MSDPLLRRIIVLVIALVLVHQVFVWLYSLYGASAGVAGAIVVAIVTLISARMAGGGARVASTAWFLLPAFLFTALPLLAKLWNFFTDKRTWWERALDFAPFVIGFALPVILLLLVYIELRKRTYVTAGVNSTRTVD